MLISKIPLLLAQQDLARAPVIRTVLGPLNPDGFMLTSEQLMHLHTLLGPAQVLPPVPPANTSVSTQLYNAYRATATYLSADGQTVPLTDALEDEHR